AHLNFDKPLKDLCALDQKPTRGDFGLADARFIAPGDPFSSVLMWRISTEGAGHMPHIGSRLTDTTGVKLVQEWIRSLKTLSYTNGDGTVVTPYSAVYAGTA